MAGTPFIHFTRGASRFEVFQSFLDDGSAVFFGYRDGAPLTVALRSEEVVRELLTPIEATRH